MKKIITKIKEQWGKFLSAEKKIKMLEEDLKFYKEDRNYWKEQTAIWVYKYGELTNLDIRLFYLKERFKNNAK